MAIAVDGSADGGTPACAPATPALASGQTLVTVMASLTRQVGGAAGWSAVDRSALLADLDRVIDGLSVVRAGVLVADRDAGAWRGAGDRSYEAARGRVSGTGVRAAGVQVRQAEQLDAAPAATAAVTEGRITVGHAAVLGKVAVTGTPVQREALADPAVQEALVQVAERQDAGTFQITVDRWAATVDPDGLERDHQARRAERYLHLTQSTAGTFLKGRLDTIAGHRLALALEALTPRPAEDDDRDPGERRADALTEMAGRVLASVDTKPGGHVPAQITMVMTPETWAAARAERDRRRRAPQPTTTGSGTSTGTGTGTSTGTGTGDAPSGVGVSAGDAVSPSATVAPVSYPPATLEDGTPVPVTELAAAMCDCDITRVVIDAHGELLDLGRTQRLFTGALRKAIIARDRECGWPSCHAPARWCEIHHIAWWDRDDGPTSADNGVPLCSFHHHETHRRDLTITRIAATATSTKNATAARSAAAVSRSSAQEPPDAGDAPPGHPPP
ncbi:DUF222 domain-containing protein [Cellulomonas sp. ATA003]|uniref:HNH endonuclease n=1 Tax=Cellulomonas sp. ATA003 TaxID=3073064 RepID=UPI0028738DD5|nr:DUF222 domain-containing protein [Cellulomonas sp. ATA003]WNB87143.1 DUF222 domain-containing protein [Cellulomonas sp. ATA003]